MVTVPTYPSTAGLSPFSPFFGSGNCNSYNFPQPVPTRNRSFFTWVREVTPFSKLFLSGALCWKFLDFMLMARTSPDEVPQ